MCYSFVLGFDDFEIGVCVGGVVFEFDGESSEENDLDSSV